MTMPRPKFSFDVNRTPDVLRTLPQRLPPSAAPLGLALVAALLGHVLLLSLHPWRRTATRVEVLTAADTTPELLRFSRRMPQQEVEATTIPLPPATTLPPPPLDVLGPLPTKGEKSNTAVQTPGGIKGKKEEGAASGTKSSTTAKGSSAKDASGKSTHGSAPGAKAKAVSSLALAGGKAPGSSAQSRSAWAAKGAGAQANTRDSEANSTSPPAKGKPDAPAISLAPGSIRLPPAPPPEALQRLRELRSNQDSSPAGSGSEMPVGAVLKGADTLPFLKLWDQAVPVPLAAGSDKALGDGVQARRLPLAAARALGLDPGQQQWIKTKDQALLVWIDGPNLWMLKSAVSPEKPGP